MEEEEEEEEKKRKVEKRNTKRGERAGKEGKKRKMNSKTRNNFKPSKLSNIRPKTPPSTPTQQHPTPKSPREHPNTWRHTFPRD